jgi:putative transposase
VISYAVWLYYRFPLSLRMVEELLAARGIELTYETVRRWAVKFGLGIARRIRSAALARGGPAWRGARVLVQSRRDRHAARRLMRKLLKKHWRAPRVLVTDKLKSYAAANRALGISVEHRQHKGLNNRAKNSHQPTRVCEKVMRRFKSARHLQQFASVHHQVANFFMHWPLPHRRKAEAGATHPSLRDVGRRDVRSDARAPCRLS